MSIPSVLAYALLLLLAGALVFLLDRFSPRKNAKKEGGIIEPKPEPYRIASRPRVVEIVIPENATAQPGYSISHTRKSYVGSLYQLIGVTIDPMEALAAMQKHAVDVKMISVYVLSDGRVVQARQIEAMPVFNRDVTLTDDGEVVEHKTVST